MIPLGVLASSHVAPAGGGGLTATYIGFTSSTADLTEYTFSGVNIGTASSDRHVIVVAHGRNSYVATGLSAVTIGGTAATIDANDPASTNVTGIARAKVTTGTTADIVVTFTHTGYRAGIGVWVVTGADTIVASDTATTNSDTTAVVSTITNPSGGVVITGVSSTGSTSFTWTNATERYDAVVESTGATFTGADTTATGELTITATKTATLQTLVMATVAYAAA